MPRSSNRYGDGDDKPDLENPHYYHPDEQDRIDALNEGLGPVSPSPMPITSACNCGTPTKFHEASCPEFVRPEWDGEPWAIK